MSTTGSVAPPGWTPPVTSGSIAPPVTGVRALPGSIDRSRLPVPGVAARPDAALRSRIGAAGIDGVLVGIAASVLTFGLGWSTDATALCVIVLHVVYNVAFELHDGRSIGKRQYGIKVAMVQDGARPTFRAALLRAVLRPVDMFPLLYTSGVISMLRTGPERRQRLGDVVAGTAVVGSGDGEVVPSPGWLLPVVAAVSVVASCVVIFGAVDAARTGTPAERADFVTGCTNGGAPAAACECIYDRVGRRQIIRLDRAVREGDARTYAEVRAAVAQTCGRP